MSEVRVPTHSTILYINGLASMAGGGRTDLLKPGDGLKEGDVIDVSDNTLIEFKDANGGLFVYNNIEVNELASLLTNEIEPINEDEILDIIDSILSGQDPTLNPDNATAASNEIKEDLIEASKLLSDLSRLSLSKRFDRTVISNIISVLNSNERIGAMSVNLTSDSIKDPEFVKWLTSELTINKLKHRLSIEFAESVACNHPTDCEKACRTFRESGLRYGIDRFGQHLASVSSLRSLKPSFVKLDHSFLLHSDDDSNHLLLKPMIKMASSLGIDVIASAVEYKQQLKRFSDTSSIAYYGYISPPEPLDSLHNERVKIAS